MSRRYARGADREHFTRRGRPKRALNARDAAVVRARGYRVYVCSVCGQRHSATPISKEQP